MDFGIELEKVLVNFLEDINKKVLINREVSLDTAADYLLSELEKNTPVDSGGTKNSWIRTTKYKGVRYINNTNLTSQNIPVVNLLEYGKKGNPFVRKTLAVALPKVREILLSKIGD